MREFYRVLDSDVNHQKRYDTSETSYGDGFDVKYHRHFMKVYGNTMAQINLPVDFLISACNQVYMNGEIYLDLLNRSIDDNGLLDISKITMNQKHSGYTIPVEIMFEFLQSFDEANQFIFFESGTVLWEYYIEKVRREEYNHLPARLESVFFFDSIQSCHYYNTVHSRSMGSFYEVEILETRSMFKGDMRIIDELDDSISRDALIEQIRKYWRGEQMESPVIEIVFQGRYRLELFN